MVIDRLVIVEATVRPRTAAVRRSTAASTAQSALVWDSE
jgi:hypothetical protein